MNVLLILRLFFVDVGHLFYQSEKLLEPLHELIAWVPVGPPLGQEVVKEGCDEGASHVGQLLVGDGEVCCV